MAMARDSVVTPVSARTPAREIVLAGDRTASRKDARRHSSIVRILKMALPVTALSIVGFFGLSVLRTTGWGTGIPELAMPKILPENLAMENPHYEGFNKDGGRYWVKADSAQQDLTKLAIVTLNGITGELVDAKKQRTTLAAKRGTFDSKANILELYDAIDIAGDSGLKARLTRATVETKESIITSREPVIVVMEAGAIKANQMTARQKAKEYTFLENVRTHLNARKTPDGTSEPPNASTAASNAMIGTSNGPVDISSNRLDVNDGTKVALFTGMVTATQDGASMTTPELEVSYEGSATPQSATQQNSSTKLKKLVAKNPVVLKQANGDTVTSQSAEFDPLAQRAVLDGEVVMTQLPDKRATAHKAEIDQASNIILLTGDVVVAQGQNILRGQKLAFNRANSKMQLTATTPAGRITARFQQTQGAPAAPVKSEIQSQGIPFGASFKTDPNAPIAIDSSRLDVDDSTKQAVFTGDVRAVQGEFVIRAAELAASYSGSAGLNGAAADAGTKSSAAQLTRIKAKNKVQITSKDDQNATGDWADFDPKANIATLGGNVVLKQGKNVVRGTKLVIDMTTGESVIKTEAPSGGAPEISENGTATGSASSTGRPTATFYVDQLKAKIPKSTGGAAGSAWKAQTAPSTQP
jgi:lipopolysaccharide transport protein LptA/LPS export ABC transporter protein LptC